VLMTEHLERGKEILKILINNGCEAYLIGEAVCNTILNLPFQEVEVTTSATPDMVKGIFNEHKVEDEADGYVRLYYLGYQFLIGTFKKGIKYRDNRRPLRIHYSKSLHDDLSTRDYTINAIAMSPAGKLTDAYRGFEDIQRKKIKTIGNPKVRFVEEPLRMLVALRFVSELGFKIENRTFRAMKRKGKLLAKLEVGAMLKELKRILHGKYFKKALKLIVESGIFKRIPILKHEFKRLYNRYRAESVDTFLACSFVKAGSFHEEWAEISSDPERLFEVVKLALRKPKGNFSPQELFFNGLELCIEANQVNRLLKKSRKREKQIRKAFTMLPIQSLDQLTFSENDLRFLTRGYDTFNNQIFETMLLKVLNKELQNNYHDLKDYVVSSLQGYYGESFVVDTNVEGETYEEASQEIEAGIEESQTYRIPEVRPAATNPVYYNEYAESPKPNNKYEDLEEKIRKLERQNLEMKLDRDVDNLVVQNLEMLKDMNYIDGPEKIMLSRELKEVYRDLITKVDPKLRTLKNNKERNDSKYEKED
jgi:tRNA nucleotidyltransferase (CCA-adding enzyme)